MVRELDSFIALSRHRHVLLDVGALHGLFSLVFTYGRPRALAVAVDPLPDALSILKRHIQLNSLTNIRVEGIALGERAEDVLFVVRNGHMEAVSGRVFEEGGVTQLIKVTTIDDLCSSTDLHLDLVKIDIEGYEVQALKGAEKVLRTDRPAISLEIHPERIRELGRSVNELVEYLVSLDYELCTTRGKTISPRDLTDRDTEWGHLVCVPDGRF